MSPHPTTCCVPSTVVYHAVIPVHPDKVQACSAAYCSCSQSQRIFRANSQASLRSSNPHPTPRIPHLNLAAPVIQPRHVLSNAPLAGSRQAQRGL